MKYAAPLLALVPLVHAAVFTVGVGKSENTGKKGVGFDPSSIHPAAGDTIVFQYNSGSHSVVQSSLDAPCTPKDGGYSSGVQQVSDSLEVDANGLPTTQLAVNDTQPLFFFDQAGGTCNQGGVLTVNPTGTDDADFKAKASTASVAPTSTSSAPASSGTGASGSAVPASTTSSAAVPFAGISTAGLVLAAITGLLGW